MTWDDSSKSVQKAGHVMCTDKPNTVVMIVGDLFTRGSQRVTLDISKGLLNRHKAEQGGRGRYEVIIIDCSEESQRREWPIPTGVKLLRLYPAWSRWTNISLPKRLLRQRLLSWRRLHRKFHSGRRFQQTVRRRFRKRIEGLAPHVIIVQSPLLTAFITEALGSMIESPPIVSVLHSENALDEVVRQHAQMQATTRVAPFRWGAVSPDLALGLASKLKVSENEIIDFTNGCDTMKVARMAREAEPTADADTILWVNHFKPRKRAADAITAFATARARHPMRLLMLGDGGEHSRGSEYSRLRALADATGYGADILMPGFAENPFADMAACAALLLTSDSEGLGMVLIEALSLGTFCVSTDCPHGPRHILNDPRLGRLAPVGDTGELAEAMLAALELRRMEPPGAREFRARNARERFGMEAAIDRYHRLVASLRAEKNSS